MDISIKEQFITLWELYFKKAELPIVYYFGDNDDDEIIKVERSKSWSCLICELAKVRKGDSLMYDADALGCMGAKRYVGFSENLRPDFEYFLSCGIPGKMEGERYKKSPEIVRETLKQQKTLPTKGKNIIFKRWDKITTADNPEVVIFFARGEVLSGLFTLANFENVDPNGVIAPFAAGCGSIIHYPYLEKDAKEPKAVLGMFDPSSRPCVPVDYLSFAIPMVKFEKMIANMKESFLITDTWKNVMKKIR
jgi:uncharacterized protein (DUF169 family)